MRRQNGIVRDMRRRAGLSLSINDDHTENEMKWADIGDMNCSVARTLSIIGDRWTMLILRNSFMGMRRFDDFVTNLGVTRHVLAARLARLVDEGIFDKVLYQERPSRFEYRLTEKGKDFYNLILVMVAWGDRWMDEGHGPPLMYRHKICGKQAEPRLVCSECSEVIKPRDMQLLPGPGFQAGKALPGSLGR
jgi:DNA-binding HxlR family transcriptional regulator